MTKTMHQAKRAIILAAGAGERLFPITKTIPKPLVKVHGQRMIDSAIMALRVNGIEEIYVVVGYLKEKFSGLEELYPGLSLIENPYYNSCNNISSLYVAKEHLSDVIIMDADQIINQRNVLLPYFEKSSYCCFWQEDEKTTEWILEVEGDEVKNCLPSGGKIGWQLQSVSFWSAEDGKKLQKDIEDIFITQNRTEIYWDDIALNVNPSNYDLGIRQISQGDIVEIDSLDELTAYDSSYLPLKQKKNSPNHKPSITCGLKG